jgi:hypothetical protein
MKVGTIIRTKSNVSNPDKDGYRYVYAYFIFKDCDFSIYESGGLLGRFEGKHFICEGSDYFHGFKGGVYGLELLDKEYEVVKELPIGLL